MASLELPLAEADPAVAAAVGAELGRQRGSLEMIASENFAPRAVLEAQGLAGVGITVNRNAIPFDPRPPLVTSGLRIGTPALAARGFGPAEFAEAGQIIAETLAPGLGEARAASLRERVAALAAAHPLYGYQPA